MGRPDDHKKGSADKMWTMINSRPKVVEMPKQYLAIYEEAKLKKQWIYDPELKRWQTPEEFLELEQRYNGGEPNRLTRLKIKDPVEGIEAGYVQLQSLKERMEVFVKRVVEYYKK